MDCPVCRDAMVVFERDEVEIDHCLGCRGIWLDAGELYEVIDGVSIDKDNKILSMLKDVFRGSLTK